MLISQEIKQCSFHFYHQLRTNDPLVYVKNPEEGNYWLFTRYEDIMNMIQDPRIISDFRKVQNLDGPFEQAFRNDRIETQGRNIE